MGITSLFVGIFIAVGIATLIAYIVLNTTRPAIMKGLTPRMGLLNAQTKVGSSSDVRDGFLSPPGATLGIYLFNAVNSKTPMIGKSQDPITVFSMGNALQFQILPGGASSPQKTRLLVKTQGTLAESEEIPIPMLPEQRWVHVCVVREGRRFTIFYNGTSVASQRTQFFPVVNSSQLTIGDPRLRGEFALPMIAPTPMRLDEIKLELLQTSNTRYEPYKPMDVAGVFAKLGGCPSGLFCFSTSKPPTGSPLQTWQTPYA
jgi:hypothetical protein